MIPGEERQNSVVSSFARKKAGDKSAFATRARAPADSLKLL